MVKIESKTTTTTKKFNIRKEIKTNKNRHTQKHAIIQNSSFFTSCRAHHQPE